MTRRDGSGGGSSVSYSFRFTRGAHCPIFTAWGFELATVGYAGVSSAACSCAGLKKSVT